MMKEDFFKFPSTPHLALLGGHEIRSDKVMEKTEQEDFLKHELTIEEKVDGANLGISFDKDGNVRVQNRGQYLSLPSNGQWKKLIEWLVSKKDSLFERLADRYILFGEWCYVQHSIAYKQLPDWFLGFDIYDKTSKCFFSHIRRDEILRIIDISQVPMIKKGRFTLEELNEMLLKTQSHFCEQIAEGFYLRFDKDNWLEKRAKLVQPTFIKSIEKHWSRSFLKFNHQAKI